MKITDLLKEDGRIVKGVNTTTDVDTNEIKTQAAKFGNKVDKDGRPPTLSTKVKGKSTNVLFNLGMAETKEAPRYTASEWAIMEGGHSLEEPVTPNKQAGNLFTSLQSTRLVKESERTLKEALGEISPNTEIFVDMDGVLADFFGEWAKSQNVANWKDIEDPAAAIKKIRNIDDFWLDLPVLPQAKELLMLIKKVKGKYKICTSPLANDPRSEPHKRRWIKENLSFFLPEEVIVTHNKPAWAKQDDGTPNILIDDYGVNINAWENAGGIGFKYKDHKFDRTAKAIKQKMETPVDERSLSKGEEKKKEKYVKGMKKVKSDFKDRYGKDAEAVMYATATKMAKENFADGKKKFVEPNFEVEWNEAARYPEFQKIGKEAWIELAKKGKEFTIKSAKGINNTDAADPNSFKTLDPAKQKRALAQLEKGSVEMPIVAVYSDGYKELVGGNTRLTAMMAKDGKATVWAFKVPDEVATLAENFADGKKKGKSRPGRVKRSGASCNGSVTALRKRAKNASGEKAKMYHWCANMKSGKKK